MQYDQALEHEKERDHKSLRSHPRTGDALFFSSNSSTGFVIKTVTSSHWNHSGVAVRLTKDGKVSLTDEGDLYVLEINTSNRWDPVHHVNKIGSGYTNLETILHKYNMIGMRRLKEKYRRPELAELTTRFHDRYVGYILSGNVESLLTVLTGVPLNGDFSIDYSRKEFFCSEFMVHYYKQCIGPLMRAVDKIEFEGSLDDLFGKSGPQNPRTCVPGDFSFRVTPESPIFESGDEMVYLYYSNISAVLIPVLIMTLFFMALVHMLLYE